MWEHRALPSTFFLSMAAHADFVGLQLPWGDGSLPRPDLSGC